jgi:hypothetical protein
MTTPAPTFLPLLNNAEAAAAIGITPESLRFWRHKGRGPRYIKYGTSKSAGVAYDPADIQAWLNERKFSSASAVSAAARAAARAAAPKPTHAPVARIVAPWQATV